MSIPNLAVSTLQRLYRDGTITAEDVVHHVYDRIDAESAQPIWISLFTREQSLERARSLPLHARGPLYGVPFAIKDNIDVEGLPTTAACPAYAYSPLETAFVVNRLIAAGAIPIGKTNLDQFATGLTGTRSPHGACRSVFNEGYVSGGSSSGSAVAVAKGLVSFALGTDTAGSGRVPAAFNNVVGLKPSRGLLSCSGVIPACRSLDCVSILALDCADAQTVFRAAEAFDPRDPFSRTASNPIPAPARLRFGIPFDHQLEFLHNSDYALLFEESISEMSSMGAELVRFDLDPFREAAQLLYGGPHVAERFAAIGSFAKDHDAQMDPTVASIVLASERYTAAEAYSAMYRLASLARQTKLEWERFDVMLLPTTPTTYTVEAVRADPIQRNSDLGYYTNFVNLLDLSAIAVPSGFTPSGLPFGVTLIAPAFADELLLGIASQFHRRRASFTGLHLANLADVPDPQSLIDSSVRVQVGVVGAHLSGQPLNHQLTSRGATLVHTTRTAKDYRFFALTNTTPAKPGLIRTPGFEGPGIEIEIWEMPEEHFGRFVALIPPPLGIGTCILENGDQVKGFICEAYAAEGMPEITHFGAWRQYLSEALNAADPY